MCFKSTLNLISVGAGGAGAGPPTSKLGMILFWSLALSLLIYSNFQINEALGKTFKPPDPNLASKIGGLEV